MIRAGRVSTNGLSPIRFAVIGKRFVDSSFENQWRCKIVVNSASGGACLSAVCAYQRRANAHDSLYTRSALVYSE